MPTNTYIVKNPTGLHARPARNFAEKAAAFPCEIKVTKGAKTVNAKSTLAVLTLGAKQNDSITILTNGERDEEALKALGEFLDQIAEE